MMDIRRRIFIITGVTVGVIVALLLLYLYVFKDNKIPAILNVLNNRGNIPTEQVEPGEEKPGVLVANPSVEKKTVPTPEYAKQLAVIFVERFSSYTNTNNNTHLEDAIDLSTAKMAKWIKTRTVSRTGEEININTVVISSSVEEADDSHVVVTVETQQTDASSGIPKVFYRSGTVNLVRAGTDWKVDGFFWSKE